MCKLCLNTRLKFDAIMLYQKENAGATFSSISDFLMNTCPCLHDDNGYFKLECCTGECSKCKNRDHPAIKFLRVLVNFYMYKITKTAYKDKKGNNKFSLITERVTHSGVIIKDLLKGHFKYFDINNEIKNKRAEIMDKQLKIPDCMK